MDETSVTGKREQPLLCTVAEAARYLSISRSSLYQLMDAGRLPYVKLGRSRRIKLRDVIALVDANTIGGAIAAIV